MKKYTKYMALAVTLALLGLIFYFSAQPGAVSYKVSETVMNTVQSGKAKAVTPQWFSTTNLNVNVRKWAHVYIYFALGVSLALWQRALLSAALCMLCAAGDELHQFFVPGRAMLLSDVGIDAMGFLPCIAAVFLCIRVYRGCRK